MTIREQWNNIVNNHCNTSLTRWSSLHENKNNKCDITIGTNYILPPIGGLFGINRLSHVYLYNLPLNCGNEIKLEFDRNGTITLNLIKNILIKYNLKPRNDKTRSVNGVGECLWYMNPFYL